MGSQDLSHGFGEEYLLTTNMPVRTLRGLDRPFNHRAFFKSHKGLEAVGLGPILNKAPIVGPTGNATVGYFDLASSCGSRRIAHEVRPNHAYALWKLARLIEAQPYSEDGWLSITHANLFVTKDAFLWLHSDSRGYWGLMALGADEEFAWDPKTRVHVALSEE